MIYKYCLINEQECFIRFKNGLLGNKRIPLPLCAYTMIWGIFPVAKKEDLTGFIETTKLCTSQYRPNLLRFWNFMLRVGIDSTSCCDLLNLHGLEVTAGVRIWIRLFFLYVTLIINTRHIQYYYTAAGHVDTGFFFHCIAIDM